MCIGNPFPDQVNEADLVHAQLTQELISVRSSTSGEKSRIDAWSCSWSPDGRHFAWISGYRTVKVISWVEGQQQTDCGRTIECGEGVRSIALMHCKRDQSKTRSWWKCSSGGDLFLAAGLRNGRINIWNATSGQLLLQLVDHKDMITDLKFTRTGSLVLASASRDGSVKLWDLEDDGNMYQTLRTGSNWITGISWSPDGEYLAIVGTKKMITLWAKKRDEMTDDGPPRYEKVRKLEGHNHDVSACDFSPDGRLLFTSSCDTRAIVWQTKTGRKILELGHMFPSPSVIYAGGANGAYVQGIVASPDGRHVTTINEDGYIRVWDLCDSGSISQVALCHSSKPLSCAYSPDGRTLAVGTDFGEVKLFAMNRELPDLGHLSRLAVVDAVSDKPIDQLPLPNSVKTFLKFHNT